MFCGYCGKENADNYSYCTGCGEALEKESPIQAVQPEDSSENQTTTEIFRSKQTRRPF